MKQLAALLFCAFCLALPLRAAPPNEGVQRLTHGAALGSLDGWPIADSLLARATDGTRLSLDTQRGATVPSYHNAPSSSELSVVVSGATHRLLLRSRLLYETDDEVLGRPALSPDGTWLVVSRTPRGNQTAPLGELWRLHVASGAWLPLTQNGVEEASPVISPDGQRVAFLRDGDVWVIPASETTVEPLAAPPREVALASGFDHVPPATIRVRHNAARNLCRPGVPDGQIDEIPFEEYVARVVPHEMPPAWPTEGLKAQAVAARTYAWRYVLADPDADWHVDDSTQYQYLCDTRYPSTDAAVAATAGQHLTHSGTLIAALFSAENASPTRQNLYGHPYLSAVNDPVSFGARRNGHGQGLSQWGARRWAERGWRYGQILLHYYTGARLEPPAGSADTLLESASRPTAPFLRGSALWAVWNASWVGAVQAREWKPDGGGVLQPGPWQTDGNAADGWEHLFDLRALPDLAEGQFRVEANTLPDTPPAERPVLFLGVDRLTPGLGVTMAPAGPVAAGERFTPTLTLASADAGSGVERVGWSHEAWHQEAEALNGVTVVSDPTASGGRALRLDPARDGAQTLRFPAIAAEPGHYRLWFRLRTPQVATAARVATLRLLDDATTPLQRGVRYLRAADFPAEGWTWFFADVDTTGAYTASGALPGYSSALVTPHLEWHGAQPLEVDRLFLATRPATVVGTAAVALVAPESLTLYASDGAGNVALARCQAEALPPLPPPPPPGAYRLFLPVMQGGNVAGPYQYQCVPA